MVDAFLLIAQNMGAKFAEDLRPGQIFQTLIIFLAVMRYVKPELLKLKLEAKEVMAGVSKEAKSTMDSFTEQLTGCVKRLEGIERSLTDGFAAGEARFSKIENRLVHIEDQVKPKE